MPKVYYLGTLNVWNHFHSQSCTFSLFVRFFVLCYRQLSVSVAFYSVKRMCGSVSYRKKCLWRIKPNLSPFLNAVKVAISHPTTQWHSTEKTKNNLQPEQPSGEYVINTVAVVVVNRGNCGQYTIRILLLIRDCDNS